MADMTLSICNT